jgi:hypothetical protein
LLMFTPLIRREINSILSVVVVVVVVIVVV